MGALTSFAQFLQAYGAYAMAAVFGALYWLERRERQKTQDAYIAHLQEAPQKMQAYGVVLAEGLDRLERAFLRHGIKLGDG